MTGPSPDSRHACALLQSREIINQLSHVPHPTGTYSPTMWLRLVTPVELVGFSLPASHLFLSSDLFFLLFPPGHLMMDMIHPCWLSFASPLPTVGCFSSSSFTPICCSSLPSALPHLILSTSTNSLLVQAPRERVCLIPTSLSRTTSFIRQSSSQVKQSSSQSGRESGKFG